MGAMDDAADALARLLGDPMVDAVRARATVLSASPPRGITPYQKCELEVMVDGAGLTPTEVKTTAVVSRKHWPVMGMTIPARFAPRHPELVELDWDAATR
jgi:hypothetical protein